MASESSFSIIVASYEQPDSVAGLVGSVLGQLAPKDEIIVADDGSARSRQSVLQNQIERFDSSKVLLIFAKHGGASRVRNIGVQRATGDYVMFIDQDAVADPTLMAEMRHSARFAVAIQGNYWAQKITSKVDQWHTKYRRMVGEGLRTDDKEAFGANTRLFAVKTDVLFDVCGIHPFAPKYGPTGDNIMGRNLLRAGVPIVLNERAIVYHTGDKPTIRGLMGQKYSHAREDAIAGVWPKDTFVVGNFRRAVLLPILDGVNPVLALSLWSAFTAGVVAGRLEKTVTSRPKRIFATGIDFVANRNVNSAYPWLVARCCDHPKSRLAIHRMANGCDVVNCFGSEPGEAHVVDACGGDRARVRQALFANRSQLNYINRII